MSRDMVKFESGGRVYFGLVEIGTDEALQAEARGKCVVNDAVLPKSYLVAEAKLVDIPMGKFVKIGDHFGFDDEYSRYVAAEHEKAEALSNSLPAGVQVGKLFATPVGDGCAYYVITQVKPRSVQIEWRGFSADRWRDRYFGEGGSFPLRKIAEYIRREEGRRELFGKKAVHA